MGNVRLHGPATRKYMNRMFVVWTIIMKKVIPSIYIYIPFMCFVMKMPLFLYFVLLFV